MKPIHEDILDIVCRDTNGEVPERMSSTQIILQMAAMRTNNCCPSCRAMDNIILVDAEHDRYCCSVCKTEWQHAWRLIHSPVVKENPDACAHWEYDPCPIETCRGQLREMDVGKIDFAFVCDVCEKEAPDGKDG